MFQVLSNICTSCTSFPHFAHAHSSPSADSARPSGVKEVLNWTPWKSGMAFSCRGHTLVVMRQESSDETSEDSEETLSWRVKANLLKSKHRIELHVYTHEWVELSKELGSDSEGVSALATKLLVMVMGHVEALASSWFPGMLLSLSPAQHCTTYMPCWKCCLSAGVITLDPAPGGYKYIAIIMCSYSSLLLV